MVKFPLEYVQRVKLQGLASETEPTATDRPGSVTRVITEREKGPECGILISDRMVTFLLINTDISLHKCVDMHTQGILISILPRLHLRKSQALK